MTTTILTSRLVCVVASILVACHAKGGHLALASYVEAYDLPPMSFMMEPQLQRHHQRHQHQQQQSNQADQLQSNDELLRLDNVKRASLKEMATIDSGNALRPASNQDVWRMIKLDQVLDALASSIPPAALAQNNWRKNQTAPMEANRSPSEQQLVVAAEQAAARLSAGGAAPHSGPAATFGSLVGARLAAAKAELAEQWPGVGGLNALAGDHRFGGLVGSPKSRKSAANSGPGALVGLVWAPGSKPPVAGGGGGSGASVGGSPTPFFSPPPQQQQQQHAQLASRKLIAATGRLQTTQQPQLAAPAPSSHRANHRLGTEEVALHTPLHSASGTDYEWKRVENSRNWNNLRGMWGKRAINERYNDLETFRNMLEMEARESGLSKSSSASSSFDSNDNSGNNGDDGSSVPRFERDLQDGDELAMEAGQRQRQLQTSQSLATAMAPPAVM